MDKNKKYIMSDIDKERLKTSYNLILSVYEYNVGSADPNDKKLCKKLEKVLKTLSETINETFIPGASL